LSTRRNAGRGGVKGVGFGSWVTQNYYPTAKCFFRFIYIRNPLFSLDLHLLDPLGFERSCALALFREKVHITQPGYSAAAASEAIFRRAHRFIPTFIISFPLPSFHGERSDSGGGQFQETGGLRKYLKLSELHFNAISFL
jgi:hypothetical protein